MAAVVFTVTDTVPGFIPVQGNGASVAATFTGGQGSVGGPLKMVVKDVLCDGGTATTTGDALTAAALGLSSVLFAEATAIAAGFAHTYDITNAKLQSWRCGGAAGAFQDAGTATASAMSHHIRILAVGT